MFRKIFFIALLALILSPLLGADFALAGACSCGSPGKPSDCWTGISGNAGGDQCDEIKQKHGYGGCTFYANDETCEGLPQKTGGKINDSSLTKPCGSGTCYTTQYCKDNSRCLTFVGACDNQADCEAKGGNVPFAICAQKLCYLDGDALTKFQQTPDILGKKLYLELKPPAPAIRIPGLTFSDINKNVTEDAAGNKYLNIPWIGELLTALYKFSIAIISIAAVVMIIIQGARVVTSGGGEAKMDAYKKIIQTIIGLAIAWGSYAILYNINPELVTFKALKVRYIEAIPIDSFVFDKDSEKTSETGQGVVMSPSKLDVIFQGYAACTGLDWRILKAVASAESNFKVNLVNQYGYSGLFQMKTDYCQAGLNKGKYSPSLGLSCSNLLNPEVNTAAAAATLDYNLKKILKKCPSAKFDDALLLLYVGHNNGPAVMNYAMDRGGCSGDDIRIKVRAYYDSQPGGKRKGVDANWGERKYKHGFKVVNAAKSYGVAELYPTSVDASKCPSKTGKLASEELNKYKILALGDSQTASGYSYSKKMIYNTVTVAEVGKQTSWMLQQISNKDLSGFTHLIIMGGVNDMASGVSLTNIENNLSSIYKKAKDSGLKVVAITITPWKGYPSWSSANHTKTINLNGWINSQAGSTADYVIDFYNMVKDPNDPEKLAPAYDSGDHLHVNAAANNLLANKIMEIVFP